MRILGPDGHPIESGPAVPPEARQYVERAKVIAENGDPASALQQMVFAFQYDVSSDLVLDTTCALLALMQQQSGAATSDELEMFNTLRKNRNDPANYQQIGHRFAQLQRPVVARPFLVRAKDLLGDTMSELSLAVDMGIAQVLMDLGAYEEAINTYHQINDSSGSLPVWLLMELAECYSLVRQLDAAQAVYDVAPEEAFEQFENMSLVREEVGDLMARVHDFDDVEEMNLRDWHYVQTRGILIELNPAPDPGTEQPGAVAAVEGENPENEGSGRFIYFAPSEGEIAYIVGVTAAFLDAKGYTPSRLLWLGEKSEALARLFSQWWEIAAENIRPYAHGDNTDDPDDLALLVMAHSYDVFGLDSDEVFVDLLQARAGLITYALDLHWTDRQPLAPDIAGFMSQQCHLPWETRFELNEADQTVTQIEDTREPSVAAEDIGKLFPAAEELDSLAAQIVEELEIYSDLILEHRDGTLARRPVVAHSPIKSPRLGF